jgi:hypothetical protein
MLKRTQAVPEPDLVIKTMLGEGARFGSRSWPYEALCVEPRRSDWRARPHANFSFQPRALGRGGSSSMVRPSGGFGRPFLWAGGMQDGG